MKTVDVSPQNKTLTQLLKQARNGDLILRTPDGRLFAVTALEGWVSFDVGNSKDFAKEVKRTGENKELMQFLAARKRRNRGKPIPLAQLRKQLKLAKKPAADR
jgi:hypothetical protein